MKLDRFINRPVLSTVISVLIVILGVLGLVSLPITQFPDIAPPTVSVRTSYTGANAQTVLNWRLTMLSAVNFLVGRSVDYTGEVERVGRRSSTRQRASGQVPSR